MQSALGRCFSLQRFYGLTQPFGRDSWKIDPSTLNVEQALADYAVLIQHIKQERDASNSPVVIFGGSYGGELAAWMRLKYPHLIQGALAASAPVLGFPGEPGFRPQSFWEIVTRDATPAAGAAPGCSQRVKEAFDIVIKAADQDAEARGQISKQLRLCEPLKSKEDVISRAYWLQGAFDAYAMGNYPFPSSYISGDPRHSMPAWPMRAACKLMVQESKGVLESLADAVGILYNATGDQQCYSSTGAGPAAGSDLGPWDFQVCTEQMQQEQPYWPANGKTDMFWDQGPFDFDAISQHCSAAWGITPDKAWPAVYFGGLKGMKEASNIVFSNGDYDPWSAFGIREDLSETVRAVLIKEGAHHLDLMWSHPDDPLSVRAAREFEMQQVERWIQGCAASA